jgi:hypothetical protein
MPSRRYYQTEQALPIPTVWGVSIPLEMAELVLRCREVRRAVAQVVVGAANNRAHLVLWIGVDPRWVAQVVYRKLANRLTNAPTPSANRIAPRAKEPRMLPASSLAC